MPHALALAVALSLQEPPQERGKAFLELRVYLQDRSSKPVDLSGAVGQVVIEREGKRRAMPLQLMAPAKVASPSAAERRTVPLDGDAGSIEVVVLRSPAGFGAEKAREPERDGVAETPYLKADVETAGGAASFAATITLTIGGRRHEARLEYPFRK